MYYEGNGVLSPGHSNRALLTPNAHKKVNPHTHTLNEFEITHTGDATTTTVGNDGLPSPAAPSTDNNTLNTKQTEPNQK